MTKAIEHSDCAQSLFVIITMLAITMIMSFILDGLRMTILLPILFWWIPILVFEQFDEITDIGESGLKRDVLDGKIRVDQKTLRVVQPDVIDVLNGCFPGNPLECMHEIRLAVSHLFRQILDFDVSPFGVIDNRDEPLQETDLTRFNVRCVRVLQNAFLKCKLQPCQHQCLDFDLIVRWFLEEGFKNLMI